MLSAEDHDRELEVILESQHRQLWPQLNSRPGWKVVIVSSRHLDATQMSFDAIFAFHHAIADGLSGMVFHRSILETLNSSMQSHIPMDRILEIPNTITLGPAVENVITFRISWKFFLTAIWDSLRPSWLFPDTSLPWTGGICNHSSIQCYESRVKILTIQPTDLTNILATCRAQKATITGLIHAVVLTSLTSHVPDSTSFSSVTPYSLRGLTGLSVMNEMGVQVGGLPSKYTPETISAIRDAGDAAQLTDLLWHLARTFRADMDKEISQLPNDNLIGMLPYVANLHNFFTSKIGTPRDETYEISNVGSLENENSRGKKWKIERVIFSQSGAVTGPAVNFSVASVAGGPMTITVTWLEGAIEEILANNLAKDVEYALRNIGVGKEVTLGL